MKKIIFLLILLNFSIALYAQQDDPYVLFVTGIHSFENELYEQVIDDLIEYIESDSASIFAAQAMYLIGRSYAELDSIATAISTLEQTYENYPFDDYGFLSLSVIGDIYFDQKEYENAKLFYTRFMYFNTPLKDKDHAFLQIEKCNYYLGMYDDPTDIYTQFFTKYPRSSLVPKLRFELANYYVTVLDYPSAIDEYNSIIESYPYCTWLDSVYYNLSLVHKTQNNWEETVNTTITLLNRFPGSKLRTDSYELFINELIANHKFLQAIDTLNYIIETAPQNEKNEYYQLLAHIYEELGLTQELVYIYQIMLQNETDPEKAALLRLKLELIKAQTGTGEDTLKPIDHELDR